MTDDRSGSEDAHALAKARRHRARRVIQALTVVCALAAAGVGAEQLYTGGLHAFLQRPPGVGASPTDPPTADPAATGSRVNGQR